MQLLISKVSFETINKFFSITNGFDEDDFKLKLNNPDEFVITYSGTISNKYQPDVFFKVLKKIKNEFSHIKFKLRMVGNVSLDIVNLIKKYNLNNIYESVGYVNHAKVIEYLMSSTVLFYIFPKTENDKGIAGKLFEYLAVRKSIVGIGPADGDSAKIIKECEAGEMFERDEVNRLQEYFLKLVEKWKQNRNLNIHNLKYLKYSRKELTKKIKFIFENLYTIYGS